MTQRNSGQSPLKPQVPDFRFRVVPASRSELTRQTPSPATLPASRSWAWQHVAAQAAPEERVPSKAGTKTTDRVRRHASRSAGCLPRCWGPREARGRPAVPSLGPLGGGVLAGVATRVWVVT